MSQPNIQNILAAMSAPALVCSVDGTLVAMNNSAASRFETSHSRVAGQSLFALFSTPGNGLTEFLQRSQRRGHALCHGQLLHDGLRDQRADIVCHAQPVRVARSSDNLLLLVFSDDVAIAAHQNNLSNRLAETCSGSLKPDHEAVGKQSLNHSSVNDSAMLADVALGLVHEVNQPLTAIAAYAHSCRRWLRDGLGDHPKLLPTMDKIIEQVHCTGQMVNSLKGLVRGQNDERSANDLNQLVRESLELLALDPRTEHCTVKLEHQTEPCPVLVSAVQVKIVLLNLLRNALDASLAFDANASRVCVSVTAEEEQWACATVSDSGAGIPAETGKQLFQPFVTSKSNGLGLGLMVSRCLATAHAGFIEHQPGVPHGASFQLRLPLAR